MDVEVTTYHGDDISEKTVRFKHMPTGTCIEVIDRSQHKAYIRGMLEMEKLIIEKTN
jgi:protein subunit release factor A